MVLNIIVIVLILAMTFMHSIFGFYSGLINLFCTIASCAVAFGLFEPTTYWLVDMGLHPAYCAPVAFVLLFVVTLIVLRFAADNLLRGNVKVPMYVDWGGGAVFGFLNAMIVAGVLVLGVLMLPLGGRVLMYEPYERAPDPDRQGYAEYREANVWLNPDDFTIGLMNILSGGAYSTGTPMERVYPDFMEWVAWSGRTPQPEAVPAPNRENNRDGFEKGLEVLEWWTPDNGPEARGHRSAPSRDRPRPDYTRPAKYDPAAGNKLLGVRLRLYPSSAVWQNNTPVHLFKASNIRIVGTTDGEPDHYPARIYVNADREIGGAPRVADLYSNLRLEGGEVVIDVYFEVDNDFHPRFVEYRRFARAAVPSANEAPQPTVALAEVAETMGETTTDEETTFTSIRGSLTGPTGRLPFFLDPDVVGRRATVAGDEIVKGRVFGAVENLQSELGGINALKQPEGELTIVQVNWTGPEARTLVGQVLNFAAKVASYQVVDNLGDTHPLAGYYAIVDRNGKRHMELFYNGPPDDPANPGYRAQLDFKNLKANELNQDSTEMSLIFLVPSGRTVTRVENNGGKGFDVEIRVP